MSATEITNRPLAVLRLPDPTLALIAFARSILVALTGNASFLAPTLPLAAFADDIDALEEAEARAATRARGAAMQRNAKKEKVIQDLRLLRAYVQSVAEVQATAANAGAMIASAGMSVRSAREGSKPPLLARNNGVSGVVLLDAAAVAKTATYFWQYSRDRATWTDAAETLKARAVISGLTSAQVHYFRFRALTRTGPIDFSQDVSLLVG